MKLIVGLWYLVDTPTGELELVAHKGLSPAFVGCVSHHEADSRQAQLVSAGKLLYIHYDDILASTAKLWQNKYLRTRACIPVQRNGQVALVNLASHTFDEFSINTRNTLEAIITQIRDVIVRFRVEEQLRQTTEQLFL